MAEEKKVKNLEEIAQDVINTQMGISSREDLEAYFNALGAGPTPQQPEVPVVEPTPAPAPQAPQAPVLPTPTPEPTKVEPPKEEPPKLDFLPEKFSKEKNVVEAAKKLAKSYTELEVELKKQKDEIGNMKKLVESLTQRPSIEGAAPMGVPVEEEIEDSLFFEKPKEAVTKLAERIAAQKILQYHAGMERAKYVENFKTANPDFEVLRDEIITILQARPDLDRDPANLPLVYNMAKALRQKKIDALKSQLGLQPQPPAPAPAPVPQIDVNKIREDVTKEVTAEAVQRAVTKVLDDIRKRKGISGIQGASAPVSPEVRTQPTVQDKPKTEEERILDEMLASGPKKLSLEL